MQTKWIVGNKCFSLRYGEGAIAAYEEGLQYPVTTMHVFKRSGRTNVYEESWTDEGKQYEFDNYPTLFKSMEEMKEWVNALCISNPLPPVAGQ